MATSSSKKTPKTRAPASINLSTRLPETLVNSIKRLALEADEPTADFVRVALENEVSRRSLCKPTRPFRIEDVGQKLDQMSEILARTESTERQTLATLQVIAVAMGVNEK